MKLGHIHLGVRDLGAAVDWLQRIWGIEPTVHEGRLATLDLGLLTLILDSADQDIRAMLGFESENCDYDYARLVERGALPLEPPCDRPWGVRSAYLAGPGDLKFELEQALRLDP